jgi:lipid A 3-O-deacylase
MRYGRILLLALSASCLVPAQAAGSKWIDSVSATLGKDNDSNKTRLFGVGVQNRWNRTWFTDGAWFLGGYWDASLAYMKSNYNDNSDLYDFSLTPMLRLQRYADISSGVAPFSEVGVGGHLLSDKEIGDRDLATNFQFGPQIGVGLGFGDKARYELAYHYQRLTNASIKQPNDGLKLHLLSFGYSFP